MSAGPPQAPAGAPSPVSHVKAQHGPGLDASLARLVEPFGGWPALVSPGERVAVKINLLRGAPPENAVSTHPETLRAVLRAVKAAGGEPFVADSPGVMEFQFDLTWRKDLPPADASRVAEALTLDPVQMINPAAPEDPTVIKRLYQP